MKFASLAQAQRLNFLRERALGHGRSLRQHVREDAPRVESGWLHEIT
jgi:hypothetical protein